MSESQIVFKIRRRDNGLFSNGGRHTGWHSVGAVFYDMRAIRRHLATAIPYSTVRNRDLELTYGGVPLRDVEIVEYALAECAVAAVSDDTHVRRRLVPRFEYIVQNHAAAIARESTTQD